MFKILIATALLGGVGLAAVPFSGALGSAQNRADCPGRLVCPLTGELVCRDRCPLDAQGDADVETDAILSDLPACCGDCRDK